MAVFKRNEERENALDRINEKLITLEKMEAVLNNGPECIGIAGQLAKNGKKPTSFFSLSPRISEKVHTLLQSECQNIAKQVAAEADKYDIELTGEDKEIIRNASAKKAKSIVQEPSDGLSQEPSSEPTAPVEPVEDDEDAEVVEGESTTLFAFQEPHTPSTEANEEQVIPEPTEDGDNAIAADSASEQQDDADQVKEPEFEDSYLSEEEKGFFHRRFF